MIRSEIAVLRFGLGARDGELPEAARDPRGWLRAQTSGAVPLVGAAPLSSSAQIFTAFLAARRERREQKSETAAAAEDAKLAPNPVREAYLPNYQAQVLARAQSAALTQRPFAERLVHFWANHFAVSADKGVVLGLAGTLENEAIRPHVNGRFIDLLLAVERHPAMIAFLDNQNSAGADSPAARAAARRGALTQNAPRPFGINENLAREILELHTLGVNGGYQQADVASFARVISGWSIGGTGGRLGGGSPGEFMYRDALHEPGPEVLLGKRFADDGLRQGETVLAALARQPATAHHLAAKLARHFVADEPPPALVERLARVFHESDGDLPRVYAALIDAPEAWQETARKFKTPEDLVFSTLRAGIVPARAPEVIRSFELLGQRQYTPGSPAGWPDTAAAWDGSDALMHRVLWTSRVAERYAPAMDPAALAESVLGRYARATP